MHELSVSPKLIGVAWIRQCNHSIYALGGLERICSQSQFQKSHKVVTQYSCYSQNFTEYKFEGVVFISVTDLDPTEWILMMGLFYSQSLEQFELKHMYPMIWLHYQWSQRLQSGQYSFSAVHAGIPYLQVVYEVHAFSIHKLPHFWNSLDTLSLPLTWSAISKVIRHKLILQETGAWIKPGQKWLQPISLLLPVQGRSGCSLLACCRLRRDEVVAACTSLSNFLHRGVGES